mmetsp:Transcript_20975/g.25813  ORF Transcript_20975/g.25813 Transcript_20975/m.25813 type:complete len:345 (-) Transcript_20975:153-1187(-)
MAPSTRRGKRTGSKGSSEESNADISGTTGASAPQPAAPAPAGPTHGLSPTQFSILVCISLALTHVIDASKAVRASSHLGDGASFTNSTSLNANATAYCVRHYRNNQTEISDETDIMEQFGCTETDLEIVNVKYHAAMLRITMTIITSILCWNNEPLLKSWSYAYATFLLVSLLCLWIQYEHLNGQEKFSLIAMFILICTTNRKGRQGRLKMAVDEGMYNLSLFLMTVFTSYIIAAHMTFGLDELTSVKEVSNGGKATYFITVGAEYSIFMVVSAFALFYFDEVKKRTMLIFMSFVTLYHAFVQLPTQKNFWMNASTRQNYVMVIFAILMAGALLPSFNQFVVKK